MAYVYILRSGNENLFKIGRTDRDLEARIQELSTGNPYRLTKFDAIKTDHDSLCERYLHHRLRSKRSLASEAREFFAVTPQKLRLVISEARKFLAEFPGKKAKAERLAEEESNGVLLKPGDREWSIYSKLLEARQRQDTFRYQRELLEFNLKIAIGRADGFDGIATWRTEAVERFDRPAFESAEPEIFRKYMTTSRRRRLLLT